MFSTILTDDFAGFPIDVTQVCKIPMLGPHEIKKIVSTGRASWFDAVTLFMSERGLDQMTQSLCR